MILRREKKVEDFKVTAYQLHSPKIKNTDTNLRVAFLSDLHGFSYGKDNSRLLSAIHRGKPNAILVTGDMYVHDGLSGFMDAYRLICRLAESYPVYYALGNHEQKTAECPEGGRYARAYEKNLEQAGVHFLHNEKSVLKVGREKVEIWGLELPMHYYRKPFPPVLKQKQLERLLPSGKSRDAFRILLAHNPAYAPNYFAWGADLILSGHYHGGVIQLPKGRGLISPQFQPFAPYSHGQIRRGEQSMIVSAGLGEHTVKVRLHDPRQLIFITIKR